MFLSFLDIIGLRRSGADRDYMGMCGLFFLFVFIWIIKLITLFLCYELCRFYRGDAGFRC